MVTRKHKIQEIQIPTWVIQLVEALTACNGRDLADEYGPLFADHFDNENAFSAALHECGITGVAQYNDDQDDDDGDDDAKTDKDP